MGTLRAVLMSALCALWAAGGERIFATRARFRTGLRYVISKTWSVELRYAWQQLRAVGTSCETTDQFTEFRLKSAFRIHDLLKAR